MYQKLLVATDESIAADIAMKRAIELADTFGARLHALYVVDSRLGRTTASKDPYEQAGKHALQKCKKAAAQNCVPLITALEEGNPAGEILEYAEKNSIDLIVLGGKNKSTPERFFISNTAERVVRQAPMSVLVVRDGGV